MHQQRHHTDENALLQVPFQQPQKRSIPTCNTNTSCKYVRTTKAQKESTKITRQKYSAAPNCRPKPSIHYP